MNLQAERGVFSLPILTFHALDDQASVISFSPTVFERGMARLHEARYRTLGLVEAVLALTEQRSVPEHSFVITFDDGYQSVYSEAFPLLREYAMCATVFLTVGENKGAQSALRLPSLSGRPMLSWGEIREMEKCGFSFGAHTLTHPDLTRLPVAQMEAEIYRSKAIIEDALGSRVTSFVYPFGLYNRRTYSFVRQHFLCACSDKLGLTTPNSDAHALKRVDSYYLRTDRLFDVMLMKLFPCYILARSIPRQIRRAIQLKLK